jgi:flagellar hook-associated protein 3
MIQKQVTRNLQTNLKRLSQLQMQLSTTKQFSRPSDNPIDFAQALNLREILTGEQRYVRNIQRGTDLLNLNDTYLSSLNDVIQRARELALSGNTDSLDDDSRRALAAEAGELFSQVLELANSSSGSIYLYAGNKTDRAPFEVAGSGGDSYVRYVGDQGKRSFEVGRNITMPMLLDGVEAFFGNTGELTGATRVGDSAGILNVELATAAPPATSGNFSINGVSIDVDVTVDTLEDLRDRINNAGADVIASIDDLGRLKLKSLRSIDPVLEDGTSNILQSLGMYRQVSGSSIAAPGTIVPTTFLLGLGIVPQGFRITVGEESADIDLTTAVLVSDVLDRINNSGLPVNAYIKSDGSGIAISATESTESVKIEDISRIFGVGIGAGIDESTTLASLGVPMPPGTIEITNGTVATQIDLSSATTVGDVLDAINDSNAGVQAVINSAGTGIDVINYTSTNDLTIGDVGASFTSAFLGIQGSDQNDSAADFGVAGEGTINLVESSNIFKALADLKTALETAGAGDKEFTLAIKELEDAFDLTTDNRSTIGARTNRLALASERFADSEVFLSQLISENEDIDLAKTVTDLTTQETVMEATLNSSSRLLLPTLLDYLS